MNIRSGDLWLVRFDPQMGSEQAGVRPALVISADRFNSASPYLKIIVPLTTIDRGWPTQLRVDPEESTGLTKSSMIMCEQVQCAAIERFVRRLGKLDAEIVNAVVGVLNRWVFTQPIGDPQ